MDTVLRAVAVYLGLLIVLRGSGQRSMAQITTFDFVLLLILGESTQQALIGNDFSVTTAMLLIVSLMAMDMTFARLKQRSRAFDRLIEGVPLVLVEDGRPLRDRMGRCQVDESDILAAARELQGLERLEQIKYAVLERSGGISIVPRDPAGG